MSDVNETNAPVQDELEQKLDKLTLTKTGYERNRNLTGCVVVIFGYYIYTGIRDGDGTWWFYALMGAMFVVAGLILWHSWKETKELQRQIDELTAEKRARDEAAAEAAASEDTAEFTAIEAAPAEQAAAAASADGAASDNQAADPDKA